jgi:hypothetical protein
MDDNDQPNRLDEDIFSFNVTKSGLVMIYWYEKRVKTLAGHAAQKFLSRIDGLDGADAQLVMAKATGNFKRGNERRGDS